MAINYVCSKCKSPEVLFDAYAMWDINKQEMIVQTTFDNTVCEPCGGECKVEKVQLEDTPTQGESLEE